MKYVELDPKAFKSKIDSPKSTCLIDVREEYEFEDLNVGGKNIPMGAVKQQLEDLRGNNEIHIICKSGNRSKAVAYYLSKELTSCTVYSCQGGIQAYKEL